MHRARQQLVNNAKQRRGEIGRDLLRTFVAGQDHREERTSRSEVAPFRHVHVDDRAVLVDRPVHVPPNPCDLDIGFVNEPAVTDAVTTRFRGVDEQRCEALHPPVDRDVIDTDPAFREEFFDVTI